MTLAAGALVDVADFGDSGWITLDLAAGISAVAGYTPQVRRIGAQCYIRGRITGLTADTGILILNTVMASEFRPGVAIYDLGIVANQASPTNGGARLNVRDTGNIEARTATGTGAFLFGAWIAG